MVSILVILLLNIPQYKICRYRLLGKLIGLNVLIAEIVNYKELNTTYQNVMVGDVS